MYQDVAESASTFNPGSSTCRNGTNPSETASRAGIRETGGDRSTAGLPSGRNVCVYLGGNLGREQRYVDEADALGRLMAAEGIGLVYGGSASGAIELLLNTTRGRRLGTRLADGLRGPGGDARGIARHRRDRKLAGAPGLNVRVELV